ncbi:MAG: hypothetical protein JKY31_07760 [Rhodobacteraceae bacterium]|nr:hypothetical protein [Paracoccaceae bacterium]
MAQYIIMYLRGDRQPTPESGQAGKEAWGKWVKSLGTAAVNPGTPMMHSMIVSPDGVIEAGNRGSTGFTIVEALDMDAAIEMAKGCPYLEMGDLEVAQLMQMPG